MLETSPSMRRMQPNRRLRQLPVYVFAWLDELKAAARARGMSLIDLGIGNPDQPTPTPIVQALQKAFGAPDNHGYPAFKGKPSFRQGVVAWMQQRFGVSVDPEHEVLCLSGSKEGLTHIAMAYIDEGDYSLVPEIYYPVHSRATWLMGGHVHHLPVSPEAGFLPRLEAVPAKVLEKARLLYLNYPNNPTGAVCDRAFYEQAIAFCKQHDLVLVNDLAYSELTYDGYVAPSIFQVPGAKDVAVEFHSFTKSFNMAGCRIGFAAGNPEIMANLYALRSNVGYGTPSAIQDGCLVALEQAGTLLPEIRGMYQERRDVVVSGFQSLGWSVAPPQGAMYLWLKVPEGYTSQAWSQHLIDTAGVVVSPGNAFGDGGEGYFRVSLVAPVAVLNDAFERLSQNGIRYA